MLKKLIIISGLLVVGIGVGVLVYFWPFGGDQDTLKLNGVVEIQDVRLGSKVGGRVKKVMVDEGDTVQPGQELVYFEVPELEAQKALYLAKLQAALAQQEKIEESIQRDIASAKATADAAKARHQRVKAGPREEEIRKALHNVELAKADWRNAKLEFARVTRLFQQGAAGQAEYDQGATRVEQTEARYKSAKAEHDLLKAGSREEDIAEAKAQWEQAMTVWEKLKNTEYSEKKLAESQVQEIRARLQELDAKLAEGLIRAPSEANVEVVAVRKGDIVAPNQPVVRILRHDDMWVKVFVPETEYGKVRLGQEAKVYLDTYPNKAFTGTVFYKGNIAEFTPRNVQNVDERRFQVFPVKIRVSKTQGAFNAGMAAKVVLQDVGLASE